MLTDVFFRPRKLFHELSDQIEPWRIWLHASILLLTGSAGRTIISVQNLLMAQPHLRTEDLYIYAVAVFIVQLVIFLISWHLGSLMISKMMPSFGGRSDKRKVRNILIMAYTPFLLAQPLAILPVAGKWIGFAGFAYTLILLTRCIVHNNLVPKERSTGFVLTSFFIITGVSFMLILLISPLLRFFISI